MHRRFGVLLLIGLLVSMVPPSIPAIAAPRCIGVSLLTDQHQFFKDVAEELNGRASAAGIRLLVRYANFDLSVQKEHFREFVAAKVDAILVAPCNSKQMKPLLSTASSAHIPVFTLDIACDPSYGMVISHVASNNILGGQKAAQLMAQALHGKGDVWIISHPAITSCMDRQKGFTEEIKHYPGIRIVGEAPAWGQRDRAQAIMEEVLVKMPSIQGVFAVNDDTALGTWSALHAAGKKPGQVVVIGYDATPEGREAIERGEIYGDVIQYPRAIAQKILQFIRGYWAKRPVPAQVLVDVGTFTRSAQKLVTKPGK